MEKSKYEEEEERKRIEKKRKKIDEEKKRIENERKIIEKDRKKLEEERKRKEEENQKRMEEERKKIEEKRKKIEEDRKRIEEERQKRIEEMRKKLKEKMKIFDKEEDNNISEEKKYEKIMKEIEERNKKEEEKRKRIEEEIRKKKEKEISEENDKQREQRKKREEKERQRREKEKKLIIENQKKARKQGLNSNQNGKLNNNSNNNKNDNNNTNNNLIQTLKDMCDYGNILKKEIENDKKSKEKEFIYSNEIKDDAQSSDQEMFALNLLAQNLENSGVQTVISKDNNDDEEAITNLQFITSGLYNKKKYVLRFDFGDEKNEKLLEQGEDYDDFVNKLKQKLSKDFGVKPDEIIITYPEKGSFQLQIIFQSDEFNQLDTNELEKKFRNEKFFSDLKNLKSIHWDGIITGCKLSKAQLDSRGNRVSGWAINEKRGNKPYKPPLGWTGFGLNVLDKYDNDNTWIGMNNSPGEWCVAYHGVGRNQPSDNVKNITKKIYTQGFIVGWAQLIKSYDDKYHPGKKVGVGVYCTPNPETAEKFSGVSEINGKKYKTVFMVRVRPDAIRSHDDNYWVVNGTTDEIRPYRILYKEC